MKRFWTIVISLLVWAAIVFYIVWSSDMSNRRRNEVVIEKLAVKVADSAEINLVSAGMIEEWIEADGLNPVGKRVDEVDARGITKAVRGRGSVSDASTYVDLEGTVYVSVTQRRPAARVITDKGYDFYMTADGYILPRAGYVTQYIPVVTGNFGLPFDRGFAGGPEAYAGEEEKKSDKNYIFLCKLINFVNYIGESDFWRSQIVQINVTEPARGGRGNYLYHEPEVELIPRAGDHVVVLGQLDGYEKKLDNLMLFYRQAAPAEGWGKWSRISLKYDNQIVCK